MSFRRCASVVLALVVSACASSPDTPLGEEFATSAAASRGTSRLIVRAQLEQFEGWSAWRAVETFNRLWLQPRGGSLISGPSYARVVVDGTVRRELAELYRMSIDDIETMRYLSASDATTRYGTGYPGGVIEVTTRRGRWRGRVRRESPESQANSLSASRSSSTGCTPGRSLRFSCTRCV